VCKDISVDAVHRTRLYPIVVLDLKVESSCCDWSRRQRRSTTEALHEAKNVTVPWLAQLERYFPS